MTRRLPAFLVLAGISCSIASAAQPQQAAAELRTAHFQHAKTFALTALDERLAILQQERACVANATVHADLRRCHTDAAAARTALQAKMHPQYEQLQSGILPK